MRACTGHRAASVLSVRFSRAERVPAPLGYGRSVQAIAAVPYASPMTGYETIPGLENLCLEDSWVLGVYESNASLSFDLEAVLTDQHPQWQMRKPGEQHSYRRLALTFPNVHRTEWLHRGGPPATDASGEHDRGHVDTFVVGVGTYELTGDWGHVRVAAGAPHVRDW